MHHPFHIHGPARFLVLSRDGQPEPNLVWKDTVLLRSGQIVDILLDVSSPGVWMTAELQTPLDVVVVGGGRTTRSSAGQLGLR